MRVIYVVVAVFGGMALVFRCPPREVRGGRRGGGVGCCPLSYWPCLVKLAPLSIVVAVFPIVVAVLPVKEGVFVCFALLTRCCCFC